jgi:hypothetical protein
MKSRENFAVGVVPTADHLQQKLTRKKENLI